jgi:hypothetical protein
MSEIRDLPARNNKAITKMCTRIGSRDQMIRPYPPFEAAFGVVSMYGHNILIDALPTTIRIPLLVLSRMLY